MVPGLVHFLLLSFKGVGVRSRCSETIRLPSTYCGKLPVSDRYMRGCSQGLATTRIMVRTGDGG